MNTKKEIEALIALIDYAIQLETRITRLEYSNEAQKQAFKAGQATESVMTAEMFNDDEFDGWFDDQALNIANSKLLFAWQMHVNELNGDKHGIPDPVEIRKFLANYSYQAKLKLLVVINWVVTKTEQPKKSGQYHIFDNGISEGLYSKERDEWKSIDRPIKNAMGAQVLRQTLKPSHWTIIEPPCLQ